MQEWHVALPMYGVTPQAREDQRYLLECFAAHLRDGGWPQAIRIVEPSAPLDAHWRDPRVLLSQTCGYPLMTTLRDRVALLAAPRYDCAGCAGAMASSRFVARADASGSVLADFRESVAALNALDSNSGMNVLRHAVAALGGQGPFFSRVVLTGGHRASLDCLRAGEADIAAIDPVTWSLLARDDGARVAGLRTLGFSTPAPTLPLIGSVRLSDTQRAAVRDALAWLERSEPAALRRLHIDGFAPATWRDYERVMAIEHAAVGDGTSRVFP